MLNKKENNRIVSIYRPIELPVIDDNKIAMEYDVVSLAKQAARKNQPASDCLHGDSNEREFKNKFQTNATQAFQRVEEGLAALSDSLSSSSVSKELRKVESLGLQFDRAVSSDLTPILSDINEAKKDYERADDDLLNFRKENKIRREAHYPESNWQTFGILALALIIESILNGSMLAAGSDGGLIGGVFIALVISIINIGIGFINGWLFLRYKNHISKLKKIAGSLGSLVFFTITLLFNLLIAHYREALVNNPDDAGYVAMEAMRSGLFSINDVQSWLLFALGLIFMILAVYKGYHQDDEYPGYGALSKRKKLAKEEVNGLKEDAIERLESLNDNYQEQLEKNCTRASKIYRTIITNISAFERQKSLLMSYKDHVQDTYLYVIKLYRDTNAAERNDPAPSFFKKEPDFELNIPQTQISYEDRREDVAKQMDALTSLEPKVKAKMLDILNMHHKKITGTGTL